MKKYMISVLSIMLILLAACQRTEAEQPAVETTMPTVSAVVVTAPVPETMPAAEPVITEPQHSEFYIPGVSVEDVILYFNEVCLDAEIVHTGDPSVLQKWTEPIEYAINGDFTSEDLTVFNEFVRRMNTIVGFPGFVEAQWPEDAPLQIWFCTEREMVSRMGKSFQGHDGAVTFWYDDEDRIYRSIICCRSDIEQYTRNSVIQEELYNGLGPIQDTKLRPDSIIYADFSEPQNLTEMDELIIRLLYHPWMECGMDAAACEAVIRRLYY